MKHTRAHRWLLGSVFGAQPRPGRCHLRLVAGGLALIGMWGCVPRERPEKTGAATAEGVSGTAAPKAGRARASSVTSEGETAPQAGKSESVEAAVPGARDPLLTSPFSDDFERGELGPDWRATSAAWSLSDGQLCGQNARNHPVWLARRLPTNAVIEFQAASSSPEGDIKAEFWGDGRSSAAGQSYTDATSYLTIFGGWKNRFHVLARLDEHGRDRREIKLAAEGADFIHQTVVPNQTYQFQVERRDGRTVRWLVDDMEIATYSDAEPLLGPGHEHFGFNDWQVRVCFDNLRVTPLPD